MHTKTIFACQKCGAQSAKWAGRCFECGAWAALAEEIQRDTKRSKEIKLVRATPGKTISLEQLQTTNYKLQTTKIEEVDRVLGGGIVPGGVYLLAGEPGIGKSTLVAQIAQSLSSPLKVSGGREGPTPPLNIRGGREGLYITPSHSPSQREGEKTGEVLYVSGEETPMQLKERFDRLSPSPLKGEGVLQKIPSPLEGEGRVRGIAILTDTNAETIAATIEATKPALAIIDSVQSLTADVAEDAGAITQLRASTAILAQTAKSTGTPLLLIGQVTKSLDIAGPKALEHLVDVVLTFEGERSGFYRLLRAAKNRFGPTDEVGVFEMTGQGLKEVKNPSQLFLKTRSQSPGSIVTCVMEGTRPILIEIQALATKTHFPYPERRASGFDTNRLNMLLAILSKTKITNYQLPITNYDIHINVTSGFKIQEPAADLAVLLAIVSSLTDKALPKELMAFGEVGLGGEIRPVREPERRVKEAKKLGFSTFLGPDTCSTIKEVIGILSS